MVKKLKVLLLVLGACALCSGIAACATMTPPEEYEAQGYNITVSYDPNGGSFMGRDGVTIVDMFNPSRYQADADGNVSIKLTEPTDPDRPSGSSEPITLTRTGYFLAGWYRTRNIVTDAEGNPVDENGAVLEETEEGGYVYADTQTTAYPAYTYAGQWDFEEDRLVYDGTEESRTLTLYACWVPYFEFGYYYEENGEWVLYDTTDFDYKTTNAEGSSSFDRDTVWLPQWDDGAMNYGHSYADNSMFEFPARDGYTFDAAYADAERGQPITDSFEHQGYVDYETGTAVNRVQNIYVDFLEGTRYRIETAEQLAAHGDADGWYEILADLDFGADTDSPVTWPAALSSNVFTGRFYSSEGNAFTVSNVLVTHSSRTALQGGMFGAVGAGAVIENVSFENVTFDIAYAGERLRDTQFGLFAGNIEEEAQISGVTLSGGEMRIGAITPGTGYTINLLANGNKDGITVEDAISLTIYGTYLYTDRETGLIWYDYSTAFEEDTDGNPVRPDVTVNESGDLAITFLTTSSVQTNTGSYVINYQEASND